MTISHDATLRNLLSDRSGFLRSQNYRYNSECGRQQGHTPLSFDLALHNADEKNAMSTAAISGHLTILME